jgi:hypothetical protein
MKRKTSQPTTRFWYSHASMFAEERYRFQPHYLNIPDVWELYERKETPLHADTFLATLAPLAGTSFLKYATEILGSLTERQLVVGARSERVSVRRVSSSTIDQLKGRFRGGLLHPNMGTLLFQTGSGSFSCLVRACPASSLPRACSHFSPSHRRGMSMPFSYSEVVTLYLR